MRPNARAVQRNGTSTGVLECERHHPVGACLPSTTRPTPLRPWVVITTIEGCSLAWLRTGGAARSAWT